MQAETQAHIDTISSALDLLRTHVDFDAASARLVELEALSAEGDFWNDQAAAQNAMREKNKLQRQVDMITSLQTELNDAVELIELGEMEGDTDVVSEAEAAIAALVPMAEKRQLESLLSGEADGNDCFLEVHAGAGGTEAQDWASMLVRMYSRWCERRGFKLQMIEESAGEEAGIKSVTMRIEGDNAYGWLKTESGVHRLVRISPYDSSARRHTSFASAWVYPVVDDDIAIEVEDKDLRVDTYDLPIQVKKRAARVTRIDRDIGLDERNVISALVRQTPTLSAHDAGCDRQFKAKWRPDRHHPLAHLQGLRLADSNNRQV